MNEPTIDVVVLGVMHHRTSLGGSDSWADIAQADTGQERFVSVILPAANHRLVRALRLARRRQTRLRVPAQFFTSRSDEQVTALHEALREAARGSPSLRQGS